MKKSGQGFEDTREGVNSEEFLIYLQAITKRAGDSVKELREKTKNLSLNKVVEMSKKFEG